LADYCFNQFLYSPRCSGSEGKRRSEALNSGDLEEEEERGVNFSRNWSPGSELLIHPSELGWRGNEEW
jgi:hypothetical protein